MSKTKILKLVMFVVALVICIGATIYLFPVMRNLSTVEGQVAFKQKVESSGVLGLLSLFALEVAQIFLFIIPGEPIEILAGMCYGWFWGMLFLFASTFIISTFIFMLVKKFGKKFVCLFCSEEKINKIENSKLFRNPKKIEKIMLILFLIPGIPKDILVYIGGLLPIKPIRFLLIATFARFPSIISSTLAGDKLIVGNWKMSLIMYAIVFLITGIVLFFIDKFDKNKITKDAINVMK